MASKIFEVDDVLPAGQIEIEVIVTLGSTLGQILSNSNNLSIVDGDFQDEYYLKILGEDKDNDWQHNSSYYFTIDTSNWSLAERTISYAYVPYDGILWKHLITGFTITFNSNGDSSISNITEATELPTPLPTPTKSGYIFVNWYYDSSFTQKATAGDTLESNVTLYAKWHNLGSLFTEIADAIREKESSSGTIRDVDLGERVKQIQGAKEEQTKTVSPTTSSQDVLPDANKVLSKVTVNAIPTETKSQQPNLSSSNQVINATSGKFMTAFTITKDTIKHIANNIREGVTLYGVLGTLKEGTQATDATAIASEVLASKTFYAGNTTKKTGTMVNRGAVNTDITTKAQEVTITQGYHSGSGKTKISATEQAKIIANNIKSGVTILGQAGGLTPAKEEETKTVTPNFSSGNVVVTPTSGKVMSQVTVNKDGNLVASNIKKDVTAFGITGTSYIAIELTQAQYDALGTKDANTYYLING